MDTDKLKSRIREALGAAGIGREISQNIDSIIDSMAGKKEDAAPRQAAMPRAEQARVHRAEPDDDDDEDEKEIARPRASAAETRARPVQKTKRPPRKKK